MTAVLASLAAPILVFLVDDHRVVRGGVSAYLELVDDIEVAGEAADGGEALARLAALESGGTLPDAVLMDLVMPGMDGMLADSIRHHASATPRLTPREREVLTLVAEGASNRQIACALVVSERTARTHVSAILTKLGLVSRTQAALWAVRKGLTPGLVADHSHP